MSGGIDQKRSGKTLLSICVQAEDSGDSFD